MKKNILTRALVAFSSLHLFAQETTKEKSISKSEEFSNKANTLIEKKFVEIGTPV